MTDKSDRLATTPCGVAVTGIIQTIPFFVKVSSGYVLGRHRLAEQISLEKIATTELCHHRLRFGFDSLGCNGSFQHVGQRHRCLEYVSSLSVAIEGQRK
jgi:hypothetical protein